MFFSDILSFKKKESLNGADFLSTGKFFINKRKILFFIISLFRRRKFNRKKFYASLLLASLFGQMLLPINIFSNVAKEQEEGYKALLTEVVNPQLTPEKFYLLSSSQEELGIVEPEPIEIKGVNYVPWRLIKIGDKIEVEWKSEKGIQKIVIDKNSSEYSLWEDEGQGFNLKATASPKFQYKKENPEQETLDQVSKLIGVALAQDLPQEIAPAIIESLGQGQPLEKEISQTENLNQSDESTSSQIQNKEEVLVATSSIIFEKDLPSSSSGTTAEVQLTDATGSIESSSLQNNKEAESVTSSDLNEIIPNEDIQGEKADQILKENNQKKKTEKFKKVLEKKDKKGNWGNYEFVTDLMTYLPQNYSSNIETGSADQNSSSINETSPINNLSAQELEMTSSETSSSSPATGTVINLSEITEDSGTLNSSSAAEEILELNNTATEREQKNSEENDIFFDYTNSTIIITHSYQLKDEKNNITNARTVIKIGFNGSEYTNEWIFSLDENQNINRMHWDVILGEENQIKLDDENITEKDLARVPEGKEGLVEKILDFFTPETKDQDKKINSENQDIKDEPALEQSFGNVQVSWKDFIEQEELDKTNQDAKGETTDNYGISANEAPIQDIAPHKENKDPITRAEHIKKANALRVWFYEEGKAGSLSIDPTLITTLPTSKIAVKNFSSNNFGAQNSGQWYLEFDASWGGMIKVFKSAEVSPFSTIADASNTISSYTGKNQPLYDAYLSSDAVTFVGNAQASTTEFQLLGNDPERIVVHTKSTHMVSTSTLTVDAYHYIYPTGKIYVTWEVTTNFTTHASDGNSNCFFRLSQLNNASNSAAYYTSYPSGYVGQINGGAVPVIKGATFMPYDQTFFDIGVAEANSTTSQRTMACSGKTSMPPGTYTNKFFVFFGDDQANVNKALAANYTYAYRTPDYLNFITGSVWNDDGDGYNESTGAYTAAFNNQQISFDIDGGNNGTTTTNEPVGESSTTVSVVSVNGFDASGSAYIIDNGVIDEFTYTSLDIPNNHFLGVSGVSAHSSSSLDVFQPTRYKPGLKIRNWLSIDEPNSLTVEGVPKTKWVDYNAGIVQFSEAWFFNYNSPASSTWEQIAAGGSNEIDSREYLDDEAPSQNYDFKFDETGRNQADILYLGAHTKFTGVNTLLRTLGTGSADLEWEYWNGSSWSHLEVTDSLVGVSDLKKSGYFTFSEPGDWQKVKINNGANLYWIRGWLVSGSYSNFPQERIFKTDVLNFRYLSNITESGATINISEGTPSSGGGLYHLVPDNAQIYAGDPVAGDVTAARYSDGSRFHIATKENGIDVVFSYKGAKPQSANKIIVYYRGYPQTQALSYQIQICDYVNRSESTGTSCSGGSSVWRNILDHGSSNPGTTLNNVSLAGAEDTFSRQFHIFNGYFASSSSPNTPLDTPVSDFISNGEMKIRFVSNITTPDIVLLIDYIAIETVVDNFYSAGDISIATGTVMAGSYTDTFTQDKAAAASCNPSVPECLWINNNNGIDTTFKFKNIATPYQGANTILVSEVGYITANKYSLSIWNASSSQWESLNVAPYTNTTNNHHVVAKSGINPAYYINGSNEIWIRILATSTSGNYFADRISITIGSTSNNASQGEISLGLNASNTSVSTASLDNSTSTVADYWIASSTFANAAALTSTMYSDDGVNAATNEQGVAANINLPVTVPNNSLVTEVIWAAQWAQSTSTITTDLTLSTYSRSWRFQVGDDITNTQTFQMGVYGACSPCTNQVTGAITQSNINSFQGPLPRPFTTAAADAFANPWMDGPAVLLVTSVSAGIGEAVATWESIDPNANTINLRVRTIDSTTAVQGSLNWDFAFVSIRYWDGVYPTLKSRVTAANGGYVVGTSTNSNWRFTKDDNQGTLNWAWSASDTASNLDLYLVMATTTLPASANKIIVNTRAGASIRYPDISFMICDFATSTGTYSSDARCPSPGGWRIINHARMPYDFSLASTENYLQFEIYNGYFAESVTSTTPIYTPLSNFFLNGVAKIRALEMGSSSNISFYWEYCELEVVTSNNYLPSGFTTTTAATIESGGYTSLYAPDAAATSACIHNNINASNTCQGITSQASSSLSFYYSFKNVVTPYQGANAVLIDARVNSGSASANGELRIYNFTTGLWEKLNKQDLDAANNTLYRFQFIKQVNNWSDYISSGEMRIGYYSAYTVSFTVRIDYLEIYLGSVINNNTVSDITSGSMYDGDPFNTVDLDNTQTYDETTYPNITWRNSGYGRNSATFDGASNQASSLSFPMTVPANALPTTLIWIIKAGVDSTSFDQKVRLRNYSGDFDIAYSTKVNFPVGSTSQGPVASASGVSGQDVYYFDSAIAANGAPYKGYYVTSPERYINPIDNSVRLQLYTYSGLYTTRGLLTWDAAFVSMNYISN